MTENNTKNLVAGLFVIFMVFVMIFIGFFLSGGFRTEKTTTYVANFKSISGLNEGSTVSYKGFKVGTVNDIKINKKNPELVSVYMKINDSVVIYNQTVATLQSVGITGQSQINLSLELKKGDKDLMPVSVTAGKIPEIKALPSKFDDILNNVSGISESLNDIAAKLNTMLSEDNMNDLNNLVESANILLYNISNSSMYFNKTLMNFDDTLSTSHETINRLNNVLRIMEYDPGVLTHGLKH